MLFYEDLVKKIEENKIGATQEIEKFSLGKQKKLIGLGIATPLCVIGLYEAYLYTYFHKWYLLLIGIIFLGIGARQIKNIFSYSIKINTLQKTLKFGKLDLNFANVNSAVLKEMKVGKNIAAVIDMITQDTKQIIVPLFMNKQERFVLLVKDILKEKFSIKK